MGGNLYLVAEFPDRDPVVLSGIALATVQPVARQGQRKRLGGLQGRMSIRRDLIKVDTTGVGHASHARRTPLEPPPHFAAAA